MIRRRLRIWLAAVLAVAVFATARPIHCSAVTGVVWHCSRISLTVGYWKMRGSEGLCWYVHAGCNPYPKVGVRFGLSGAIQHSLDNRVHIIRIY